MSNILVIAAHQDCSQSVSNSAILNQLSAHFGDQIELRRLSDLYPTFNIDVAAEQAALQAANVVVFVYPTFWFNTPSIFKKWMDDVLTYGFAYGEGGDKLHGKAFLLSTTTGSPAAVYNSDTLETIETFTKPVEHSVRYVGGNWQGVYPLHGTLFIAGVHGDEDLKRLNEQALAHAQTLIAKIETLLKA